MIEDEENKIMKEIYSNHQWQFYRIIHITELLIYILSKYLRKEIILSSNTIKITLPRF
jgi:hypothetical protein